jgi:hypothetical protein
MTLKCGTERKDSDGEVEGVSLANLESGDAVDVMRI